MNENREQVEPEPNRVIGDLRQDDNTLPAGPNSISVAPSGTMLSPGVTADRSAVPTVPAPPLPLPPQPGKLIDGKYELLELIASGGMGRVFRARHLELRTPLAIKIMHDFIAANPEHVERFRREALAASKLNHPNVVRVLDYGKLDQTFYIVMELLEGQSLGDWLDTLTVPPPLSDILPVLLQIIDALIAAHEAGVVHRDLKPDNVILTRDVHGAVQLKVVDLGLARFRDLEHNDGTITQADAVAGTPAYMSPEQCRSLKVTHSTDLYAFGCILTELLQLTPPFAGETVIDTISKHMFAPVPPLTRAEGCERVPAALERLRRELLAKLPAQRPSDARTVRARLVAAFSDDDVINGAPARKPAHFADTREERTPAWNRQPGAQPEADVPEGVRVGHLLVGTGNVAVNEACLLGLRAQNYSVVSVLTPQELEGYRLVLLDVCADAHTAVVVTRTVRERFSEMRIVVCVNGLTTALMNQLIEVGADDVARGPVTSEGLGRKVNRLLRRRTE